MSSIRLFILGALDIEGEMHGHQLRQLAEKEHIDMWTDITWHEELVQKLPAIIADEKSRKDTPR